MTSAVRLTYNTVAVFRKTLTILSLIGLLLSVGLWGASYWHVGLIWPPKIGLAAGSGTVDLGLLRENGYVTQDLLAKFKSESLDARVIAGSVVWSHGFTSWHTGFWRFTCETFNGMTLIRFPLWLPCLLFAATPVYDLTTLHRRRKRKKLGLCVKCGYDLRGSKERCPECGSEFGSSGV